MQYQIRNIDPGSIDAVHEMNEQSLPHVNSVSADYFHAQLENDCYFRGVYEEARPLAFLLAMDETAEYDSLNFLWFRDRYPEFVYIDRVVVDASCRRSGMGLLLYRDLLEWAGLRKRCLVCEVNLRPPNEASMRFHKSFGFEPVGTQETDNGHKTVSLMIREKHKA